MEGYPDICGGTASLEMRMSMTHVVSGREEEGQSLIQRPLGVREQ